MAREAVLLLELLQPVARVRLQMAVRVAHSRRKETSLFTNRSV